MKPILPVLGLCLLLASCTKPQAPEIPTPAAPAAPAAPDIILTYLELPIEQRVYPKGAIISIQGHEGEYIITDLTHTGHSVIYSISTLK
jgi:hypothetical protein